MKQATATGLIFFLLVLFAPLVSAQWAACVGCHSGTIAPDENAMKEKFQTVKALVNAAMSTTNPMMKEIQQSKEVIEAAARELGLKEGEEPTK